MVNRSRAQQIGWAKNSQEAEGTQTDKVQGITSDQSNVGPQHPLLTLVIAVCGASGHKEKLKGCVPYNYNHIKVH